MAVDVQFPPEIEERATAIASKPAAEIDVRRLLERFQRAARPEVDETIDFGLECAIRPLDPRDRIELSVEACPACGGERARPRFAIEGVRLRLVDCTQCGLGRLHPPPGADAIRRFYPASYYGVTGAKFVPAVERLVRLVGSRHVRALSRGLVAGARVLDVGCGRGVLLSALADRGFDVHGFEISEAAAAGADPRATIRVGADLAEVGYPSGHFDQVVIWHVLELLPDPRATLREIRRILKPGGRLVLAVPNYGSRQARWAQAAWFHLDLPRHLFHFPVTALRRLIDDAGFIRSSEHHFSLRQNPFGWVQSALNRIPGLPRNGLYRLLKSGGSAAAQYGPGTRFALRSAYWLGMPLACALSAIDAVLQTGASVCIVAKTAGD